MIYGAVFVVKIAITEKEMHSHKLCAMADNYPADWCINRLLTASVFSSGLSHLEAHSNAFFEVNTYRQTVLMLPFPIVLKIRTIYHPLQLGIHTTCRIFMTGGHTGMVRGG